MVAMFLLRVQANVVDAIVPPDPLSNVTVTPPVDAKPTDDPEKSNSIWEGENALGMLPALSPLPRSTSNADNQAAGLNGGRS